MKKNSGGAAVDEDVGARIETELAKCAGVKRGAKLTDREWVRSVCAQALDQSEEQLAELSDEAYDFANSVADLIEARKVGEVKWFDGSPIEDPEVENPKVVVDESKKSRGRPRRAAAVEDEDDGEGGDADEDPEDLPTDEERKDAADPEEEEAPKRGRVKVRSQASGDYVGRIEAFREMVLQDWNRPRAELMKVAAAAGIEVPPASASTVIYHVQKTLELLRGAFGVDVPDKLKLKKSDDKKSAEVEPEAKQSRRKPRKV